MALLGRGGWVGVGRLFIYLCIRMGRRLSTTTCYIRPFYEDLGLGNFIVDSLVIGLK